MSEIGIQIKVDSVMAFDVAELATHHVADVVSRMPPGEPNSFDVSRLAARDVTLWSARGNGTLAGIVAVKWMDATAAELKSMRVSASFEGRGIGSALLRRAISECRLASVTHLYLETATGPFFDRAANIYAAHGFVPCEPFGDYLPSEHHRYMMLDLSSKAYDTALNLRRRGNGG